MKSNRFLFCPSCQELFQVEEIESFWRKEKSFWVFPNEGPIVTLPKLVKCYPTMMRAVAGFCVYQALKYGSYPDCVCSLGSFEDRTEFGKLFDSDLLAKEVAKILNRPVKKFSQKKASFPLQVEKKDLQKKFLFVGGYFNEEVLKSFQKEGSFLKKEFCFVIKKD
jgi:hypothetical protein